MTAKRKRGRPVGSGRGLTARAQLRMTPDEKATVEAAAEAAGLATNEWIRRACGYCAAVRVSLVHVRTGPLPGFEVE